MYKSESEPSVSAALLTIETSALTLAFTSRTFPETGASRSLAALTLSIAPNSSARVICQQADKVNNVEPLALISAPISGSSTYVMSPSDFCEKI